MTLRDYVLVLLIVAVGISVILYGQVTIDVNKPGTYLVVEEPISRGELSADSDVLEYEDLAPDVQQKFRRSIGENPVYLEPSTVSRFTTARYVHYQGLYYPLGYEFNDRVGDPSLRYNVFGSITIVVGSFWGFYKKFWKI